MSQKSDRLERQKVQDSYQRFKQAEEAERENREDALDDIKFSLGGDDQWDQDVLNERDEEDRPHLTNNKLPAFIHQICNNQRTNRPAILISPVSNATIATAQVLQGLCRHIEYRSDADSAYDTATEFAVRGGFGHFRVLTEYVDDTSFDQELLIQRIDNPFSVYMDPAACEPDRSDAKWAQIGAWLTKEEYKRMYGKSDLAKESDWDSLGDACPRWLEDERCRVVEEFLMEFDEKKLYLTLDKKVLLEDEVESYLKGGAQLMMRGDKPVTRMTMFPKVTWRKINGIEVIDEQPWPGHLIPVVAVIGKEINVDGKRRIEGMTRQAKDPQKMVNFYATAQAEAIALAPKSPWLVPVGGDEGLEKEYAEVNRRNLSILHYNAWTKEGKQLDHPTRETIEPAIAAINHAYMTAGEDLKSALGLFDPNLGARDAAQSGVAIRNLQNQGDMANFHFADNLHKSIRHLGRILIDLIPAIYDTERTIRIIGVDDEPSMITVNSQEPPEGNPIDESTGLAAIHDLTTGKYDVTVKAGPSFQSRRQEEGAFMLQILQSRPDLMQVIGDLVFKSQDSPGAQQIAARLHKLLPPALQDQQGGQNQQIPPVVKQEVEKLMTLIQNLTTHLNAAQDELEDKKLDLASKERIALYQTRATILGKLTELHSEMGMSSLETELSLINARIGKLNTEQPLTPDPVEEAAKVKAAQQPPPGGPPPGAGPMAGPPGGAPPSGGPPMPTGGLPPGQPQGGVPNAT